MERLTVEKIDQYVEEDFARSGIIHNKLAYLLGLLKKQISEPRVLHCPNCGQQHIDVGEFATRLHRTHRCTGEAGALSKCPKCEGEGTDDEGIFNCKSCGGTGDGPGCGHEWQPELYSTVGVEKLDA